MPPLPLFFIHIGQVPPLYPTKARTTHVGFLCCCAARAARAVDDMPLLYVFAMSRDLRGGAQKDHQPFSTDLEASWRNRSKAT